MTLVTCATVRYVRADRVLDIIRVICKYYVCTALCARNDGEKGRVCGDVELWSQDSQGLRWSLLTYPTKRSLLCQEDQWTVPKNLGLRLGE